MNYALYIDADIKRLSSDEVMNGIYALPQWRRKQALAYKFDLGRRQCLLSYNLLCKALRERYQITEPPTFIYSEHGKPSIEGHPEIHFNISHCSEAVACVVSDHPVGVDVEMTGRYNDSLARYCMNDEEVSLINASESQQEAFTLLWTKKEAVAKCTGRGIDDNIKDLLLPHNMMYMEVCAKLSADKRYAYAVCIENKLI